MSKNGLNSLCKERDSKFCLLWGEGAKAYIILCEVAQGAVMYCCLLHGKKRPPFAEAVQLGRKGDSTVFLTPALVVAQKASSQITAWSLQGPNDVQIERHAGNVGDRGHLAQEGFIVQPGRETQEVNMGPGSCTHTRCTDSYTKIMSNQAQTDYYIGIRGSFPTYFKYNLVDHS